MTEANPTQIFYKECAMSDTGKVIIEIDYELSNSPDCSPDTYAVRTAINQIFVKDGMSRMNEKGEVQCMGFMMKITDVNIDIQNQGNGSEF